MYVIVFVIRISARVHERLDAIMHSRALLPDKAWYNSIRVWRSSAFACMYVPSQSRPPVNLIEKGSFLGSIISDCQRERERVTSRYNTTPTQHHVRLCRINSNLSCSYMSVKGIQCINHVQVEKVRNKTFLELINAADGITSRRSMLCDPIDVRGMICSSETK
jgi:hypothetical protein